VLSGEALAQVPDLLTEYFRLTPDTWGKDLTWHPTAARALQAIAPLFDETLEDAQMPLLEGVTQKLDKYYRDYLSSMGLQASTSGTLPR
jgi:hypothetical protein